MAPLNLDVGLRALLTSQAALDTVGHNITNANTPGYSRQSLSVSAASPTNMRGLLIGNGVRADVVTRVADELLNRRLAMQTSSVGRLGARLDGMLQAETFFAPPGSGGIDSALEDFFTRVSDLAASPADATLRSGVVQAADQLGGQLGELFGGVTTMRREGVARLEAQVDEVNLLANRIAELNQEILTTEGGVAPANDLRDRRDQALNELARLVDVQVVDAQRGAISVLVDGRMLVSPTRANQMAIAADVQGNVEVRLTSSDVPVDVGGGSIGGLAGLMQGFLPDLAQRVDDLARNVIFEMNRAHSTGLPASGPFHFLVGSVQLTDADGDGQVTDELLSSAGMPFDVSQGELFVNVSDDVTGDFTRHRIAIDPARTTVGDLLSELGSIPHLTASLDGLGRVQVAADAGHGFDFSRRLAVNPDTIGSFGGGPATLVGGSKQPFGLLDGDTLQVSTPGGTANVTFLAGAFQQNSQATAGEVAAVINADASAQAVGLTASVVDGALVLQTAGSGSSESLTVNGGSALAALGLTAGASATGSDTPVDPRIGGAYTGMSNERFTFRPSADGTIGGTPGLQVEVFDSSGSLVATLDVGDGYRPGDELEVVDGVRVAFGFGNVSATTGELFTVDALAQSDSAGVLAATGINALFVGQGADDIAVRADLLQDPARLAASVSGASGDGGTLNDLLALAGRGVDGLSGSTLGEGYGEIASGLGLDIGSTRNALETEQFLFDGLQARRDQLSGVNVDEELVDLIEFEQAFAAASQYIRVVSQLTDELLNIL